MVLSSAITKRLDAAWAVGSGNGGLDTGAIANTTYQVWLIQRSDTGVVDALFSTSATSPTMPTNYDRKRRIGSIVRESGAVALFSQVGDVFRRKTGTLITSSTSTLADQLVAALVPVGIVCSPIITVEVITNANSAYQALLGSAATGQSDIPVMLAGSATAAASRFLQIVPPVVFTNTSGQIWIDRLVISGTVSAANFYNRGWVDTRGRT